METQKVEQMGRFFFSVTHDVTDSVPQMVERIHWIDYVRDFIDFLKRDDLQVEHSCPNISDGTKYRTNLTILSGHDFFPFWRFCLSGEAILKLLDKKGWRPANVREFLSLFIGQKLRISHLYALGSRWTNSIGETYVSGICDGAKDFYHKKLYFTKFNERFARHCYFLVGKKQE